MRLVAMAAVATMVLFAVVSASASAAGSPGFEVNGSALGYGSSDGFTAEANGTQVLKATGVEIDCTGVGVKSGAEIIGDTPGQDKESLRYTGCTVKSHESTCTAKTEGGTENGVIETQSLVSKLAFKSAKSAEEGSAGSNGTVTVFEPEAGASEPFVKISLTGTCGFVPESSVVKGSVVVTNIQATNNSSSAKETQEISAEGSEKYFTNPGAEEHKSKLTAFGLSASYKGKVHLTLVEKYLWRIAIFTLTFREGSTTGPAVPVGTKLSGKGSSFVLHTSAGNVECPSLKLAAELQANEAGDDPLKVTEMTLSECTTSFSGKPTATVTVSTPFEEEVVWWWIVTRAWWLCSAYHLTVTLSSGPKAVYGGSVFGEFTSLGVPLVAKASKQALTKESGESPFEEKAELSGEYTLKTAGGEELAVTSP